MKTKFLKGLITCTKFMEADGGTGTTGAGTTGTGDTGTTGTDTNLGQGTTGDNSNKSFTQEEVNKIIADRVAREKKKFEGVDVEEYQKLKKAQTDSEEANKTELQKAQDKLKAMEDEKKNVLNIANQRLILAEFKLLAKENNIKYVDDAFKLSDLSSVTVKDDGTIEGIKEIVKALITEKPFLVESSNVGGTGSIDKKSKGQTTGTTLSIGEKLAKEKTEKLKAETQNHYFK